MINKARHPLGTNLESCTGCAACAAVCIQNAIEMRSDLEGFAHPQIKLGLCNNCNICRQICPVNQKLLPNTLSNNQSGIISPPLVYAAWNTNEQIRMDSSSGGVFTALAENVLKRGGAVVGAAFDANLVVRHILIDKSADIHRLRGSKYVQSEIDPNLYRDIHNMLKNGRYVLFSGTPCQVAGLRGYLRREYDTLWCCDMVCHGVPSPLLLEKYVQHYNEKGLKLLAVSFRNKISGWKKYSVCKYFDNGEIVADYVFDDAYMAAFLSDISLRLSCYKCQFANISRGGDITIADFWGVSKKYPEYDRDDKGTSLVLVNNVKGKKLLDECGQDLFVGAADLAVAAAGNPALVRPVAHPRRRDDFYRELVKMTFDDVARKYRLYTPSFLRRAIALVKHRLWFVVKIMRRR